MQYLWMSEVKNKNKIKTVLLCFLFPILFFAVIFLFFMFKQSKTYNSLEWFSKIIYYITAISTSDISSSEYDNLINNPPDLSENINHKSEYDFKEITRKSFIVYIILLPIFIVFFTYAYFKYEKIIFKISWAKYIDRKNFPELWNIVENVCISVWVPNPKIWIAEDSCINSFVVWLNTNKYTIVFTRWLLNSLNKPEIEWVVAHLVSQVINKDSQIMIIISIFVWIFTTIWTLLLTSWNIKWKWKFNFIKFIVWIFFLFLWLFVFPINKFFLSQKMKFIADISAIEITKNKDALLSALQKSYKNTWDYRFSSIWIMLFAKDSVWFFDKVFETYPTIRQRMMILSQI